MSAARPTLLAVLAGVLVALGATAPAAAGELFLVDSGGLYKIDATTADKTLVGAGACDGLALSPTPSRYLFCSLSREAGGGYLYELRTDGSSQRYVATIDGDADRGLAYNMFDGRLYGTDNYSFGVIDPVTGAFTALASPASEPESLAADPIDNLIYGVDRDESLIVYDVATDTWSTVGPTQVGGGGKGGLAFDPDADVLYFVETGGDLYRIDPDDGFTTWVGQVPDMDEFAGLTYLRRYDPVPDIKLNGLDGPITMTKGARAFLTIELDGGELVGDGVDLWISARTPRGWYSFDLATGAFVRGLSPAYQGPLFEIDTLVIWDESMPPGLRTGWTTFHLGVDTIMNGVLDAAATHADSVKVKVRK